MNEPQHKQVGALDGSSPQKRALTVHHQNCKCWCLLLVPLICNLSYCMHFECLVFFPTPIPRTTEQAMPHQVLTNRVFLWVRALPDGKLHVFTSVLRLITHLAKIMGSWAAAISRMAPRVMWTWLLALGGPRLQRQDMCFGFPEIRLFKVSHWWAHFILSIPAGKVGCHH